MSDKRTVARVIHGLYARNDVHQCRIMAVNMFYQFCLGICWTRDENGTRALYRLDNSVKEILIL